MSSRLSVQFPSPTCSSSSLNSAFVVTSFEEMRRARASIVEAKDVDDLQTVMGGLDAAFRQGDVGLLLLLANRVRQVVDLELKSSFRHDMTQAVEFLEGAALYCLDKAADFSEQATLETVCKIFTHDLPTLPLPAARALLKCLKAHECECAEKWSLTAVNTLRIAVEAVEASEREQRDKYCNADYRPSWIIPIEQRERLDVLSRVSSKMKTEDSDQCFVWVSMGHGKTSVGRPLVSLRFRECSAVVMKNLSTSEYLLMHLNKSPDVSQTYSGAAALNVECHEYQRFMNATGKIVVLPIMGSESFNRDKIVERIVRDGATALPTLSVDSFSGGRLYDSPWNLVVVPGKGELIIELPGHRTPAVLIFSDIFA